jgi:hypothetical protein
MKFTSDRPYGDPEKAARKLVRQLQGLKNEEANSQAFSLAHFSVGGIGSQCKCGRNL